MKNSSVLEVTRAHAFPLFFSSYPFQSCASITFVFNTFLTGKKEKKFLSVHFPPVPLDPRDRGIPLP
jgi:hypothetical protein